MAEKIKDVEKKYSCELGSCNKCSREGTQCKNPATKMRYARYRIKRKKALNKKFACEKNGNKRCSLKKCENYKVCTKSEKKDFMEWKRAFFEDNRKIIEQKWGDESGY